MRSISARELNQDVSAAKRAADEGPVMITDRGRPAYVLMTYAEYERTRSAGASLGETAAGWSTSDDDDFDQILEEVRRRPWGLKIPDVDG